jgi:16S rRNA (adenine1518-N6/adenine1519-N6)-dimethyltransferase
MAMYKPTELLNFLNQLGIHPKKGLSQNFLIDGNIIRKIVKSSKVEAGDIVLEIGPGPGSLTQALLEVGATVVAVEKDPVLSQELHRLQTEDNRLKIYCEDIMKFPMEDILTPLVKDHKKIKIIANLPYHLTTPILTLTTRLTGLFSSLTVMVQEEVGRRMAAQVGSKDYSSLSVFLRFYTDPHYAFSVSRHCFYPQPKVDSAVVVLSLHETPLKQNSEIENFFMMTRRAFEHRRKMLRSSLKELFPTFNFERALEGLGLNPLARPEELSLENFLALYHVMQIK